MPSADSSSDNRIVGVSADDLIKLQAPFDPKDIEWRAQTSGISRDGRAWVRVLAYIDNRAVMKRLDDVCGPSNWRDEYDTSPVGGVLCGISIRVNGEWITKWDGAETTDIEPIKGALSGSEKRTAVKWGIGRYLYELESKLVYVNESRGDNWIRVYENNKTKQGKQVTGYWSPPNLPGWALPPNMDSRSHSDIVGGAPEVNANITDHTVTAAQIVKMKALCNKLGMSREDRDMKIRAVLTYTQGELSIERLNQLVKAKEAKAALEAEDDDA